VLRRGAEEAALTMQAVLERREWWRLFGLIGAFVAIYLAPLDSPAVAAAVGATVQDGLALTRWYAREHVVLCLLPALVIAGAIAAYVDKAAVLRYLGPRASKPTAYGVGATSGGILAVCSCTVLPIFAGIYRAGAGLGPASAFLYAGPAINVLAVILTARVLGAEIGIARALGAVVFSVVIGLIMALLFERKRPAGADAADGFGGETESARPLRELAALFALLVAVLVFANWSAATDATGFWHAVHVAKWWLTGAAAIPLAFLLWRRFGFPAGGIGLVAALTLGAALALGEHPAVPFTVGVAGLCVLMPFAGEQGREWAAQTWGYAKLILPLLLAGVFVAGLLLGAPGSSGLVPPEWIERSVGGNGVWANFGASVVGAFMYFATLTEVPILEGLLDAGMGKGPALALLLAGPALSLPNMLVIRSVLGTKKTAAYVLIVVVGSTLAGILFGAIP
jgi:hypothetical protein